MEGLLPLSLRCADILVEFRLGSMYGQSRLEITEAKPKENKI